MQVARRPIEAIRAGGPVAWVLVASVAAMAFAYSSLLTLGTRYGFEKGVEYWLFRPTDNAPLVILVLSGWLLYRRWYRVRALPPATASPSWIALCVAGAVASHAWANYTSADDLEIVSLVFALTGLVLAWRGVAGVRALWLPIVFLLFAIPMPAPLLLAIVYKLQIWTAEFAGFLLYMLGMPALVSGDQIVRATQTFQVIEGCSGMRSIETLTMLTVLLIDLFGRRGWHAALLLLAAPPIAFLLNGVRVLTLILNPHSEIIAIHNLQGIAILLVGLLLVYGIDAGIERLAGDRLPAPWRPRGGGRGFARPIALGTLVVIAAATTASALWMPTWTDTRSDPRALHELVAGSLGDTPYEKVDPDFAFRGSVRFAEVVHRRYELADAPVTVFVGTADLGQRGGSPVSPITVLPGSGWMQREPARTVEAADGRATDVRVLEKGKQRVLVQHWYHGNRGLWRETWRSLMALDRSPLRRPEVLYVARLETPITGHEPADRTAAEARLARVYERLRPTWSGLEEAPAR